MEEEDKFARFRAAPRKHRPSAAADQSSGSKKKESVGSASASAPATSAAIPTKDARARPVTKHLAAQKPAIRMDATIGPQRAGVLNREL